MTVPVAEHIRCSRTHLLAELGEARRRTDTLFDLIGPARLTERPIGERHPFLFYLGHLEAFDWNLLHGRFDRPRGPLPFDRLFAFGIDPLDGNVDAPHDWPEPGEIHAYNRVTRSALDAALPKALDAERFSGDDPHANTAFLVHAAIEHRLMHAETMAYMLYRSAVPRRIGRAPVSGVREAGGPSSLHIPAGKATLGIARSSLRGFAWDNEHDTSVVDVPAFEIGRCKVSNGEYLRFVEAGGYEDASLWTAEGWHWRERADVRHPAFWQRIDGRWHVRTPAEWIPLPADWPVYVSHSEASAYARWAGATLPSEAQWHRAAFGTPDGGERPMPWGDAAPDASRGLFDFNAWTPGSVDAHPAGDSAFGVRGLVGNGWEWTSTPFAPFEGFRAHAFYPGYSADFFDGRHFVLKGASPRTAARFLRRSFRNWYQANYPYVFAGFRCARSR